MADFAEKYINPFTDYGFKRLFGEEPSKELLLDFPNELLKEEQGVITKLTYLKSDRPGSSEEDSLKSYRDLKNSLDTAREEGREEGREEEKRITVLKSHRAGLAIDIISSITGLSKEEVERIIHQ